MTFPAVIILWVALGLLAVALGFAAAHVIQGLRFSHGDRHILVATLAYIVAVTAIIGLSIILTMRVDWSRDVVIGGDAPAIEETEEQ